jgi:REP element-mobilizing transposase RayT
VPQSLANVLVHLIFSTKERQPFLRDVALREQMHHYLAGISKDRECTPIRVGGTEDHVHILAQQARTITLADWTKELKRGSSLWIKTREKVLASFQWQNGYGAFSVSPSQCPEVDRYITNQEEHHRKLSFQDEYRLFLRKHGIEYDERYVWDRRSRGDHDYSTPSG